MSITFVPRIHTFPLLRPWYCQQLDNLDIDNKEMTKNIRMIFQKIYSAYNTKHTSTIYFMGQNRKYKIRCPRFVIMFNIKPWLFTKLSIYSKSSSICLPRSYDNHCYHDVTSYDQLDVAHSSWQFDTIRYPLNPKPPSLLQNAAYSSGSNSDNDNWSDPVADSFNGILWMKSC